MTTLTTLTLRRDPTAVGEHYRVFDGDRYVGRIYCAGPHRWFWSLAFALTEPADPPHGWREPTREAAMEKLKAAYRRPESSHQAATTAARGGGRLEPVETDRRDATMVRRSLAPAGHISTSEAALRSGYTIGHLVELARAGRLQARLVRRSWFIDEQALEAFLANQGTRPKRGRPGKSMRPV